MPCLGQCPDVGRGSEDKDYRDCGATQRCRQYGLADCMHTAESSCAHEKLSAMLRCAATDPALPQAVMDQVARTSADGF